MLELLVLSICLIFSSLRALVTTVVGLNFFVMKNLVGVLWKRGGRATGVILEKILRSKRG